MPPSLVFKAACRGDGCREEGNYGKGHQARYTIYPQYTAMIETTNTQAGQTKGRQLVRSHYLVAVTEKRVSIGRFGFREGAKGEAVVDIGNAKTEAEARSKAVARYAKAKRVNPILVEVSQVTKVEPAKAEVDRAFSLMDLGRLASAVGAGQEASCGILTIKVRRA